MPTGFTSRASQGSPRGKNHMNKTHRNIGAKAAPEIRHFLTPGMAADGPRQTNRHRPASLAA
eukprot:8184818-Alexandrium_andersonii.AAC.1